LFDVISFQLPDAPNKLRLDFSMGQPEIILRQGRLRGGRFEEKFKAGGLMQELPA
jgi:hypothetical protein